MPSLTYKVDKVYNSPSASGQAHYISVPGQFQSLVPPRFGMLNGTVRSMPTRDGSIDVGQSTENYENLDRAAMAFDPNQPLEQGILDSATGEMIQPVIYDRLIYANRKSKLIDGADFIRGDLPIMPQNLGWFSPSVQPHIDLRQGIIDNFDKDTADRLKILQMKSQGKFDTAFEGEMKTPRTIIPLYGTFINPNVGDIEVVNF